MAKISPLERYLAERTPGAISDALEDLQQSPEPKRLEPIISRRRRSVRDEDDTVRDEDETASTSDKASIRRPQQRRILGLMSKGEHRKVNRLPRPTPAEEQAIAEIGEKLNKLGDFCFDPRVLEPRKPTKLDLATKKVSRPLIASALYAKLYRAGPVFAVDDENEDDDKPADVTKPPTHGGVVVHAATAATSPRRLRSSPPLEQEELWPALTGLPREDEPFFQSAVDLVEYRTQLSAEALRRELNGKKKDERTTILATIIKTKDVPKEEEKKPTSSRKDEAVKTIVAVLERVLRRQTGRRWRRWRETAKRLTRRRYNEATEIVQRAVIRHMAFMEIAERSKLLREQAEREDRTLRRMITKRRDASVVVQRHVRGMLDRHKVTRLRRLIEAVRRIQVRRRSKVGAMVVEALRRDKENRCRCAVLVQKVFRGNVGRRRARAVVAARRGDRLTKVIDRHIGRLHETMRRDGAASAIQSLWRRREAARSERAMHRVKRIRATKVIEVALHRYIERYRRRRHRLYIKEHARAALVIALWTQTQARRRFAVQEVAAIKFDRRVETVARCKYRAYKLERSQSLCTKTTLRSFRRTLIAMLQGLGLRTGPHLAATRIQKTYRGARARSRTRLLALRRRLRSKEATFARRHAASARIAAVVRGVLGRRYLADVERSRHVQIIQVAYRGLLGRRIVRMKRSRNAAATKIQSFLRSRKFLLLKTEGCLLERQKVKPALRIQTLVRRIFAVRRVEDVLARGRAEVETALKVRGTLALTYKATCVDLAADSFSAKDVHCGEFQAVFHHWCHDKGRSLQQQHRTKRAAVAFARSASTTQQCQLIAAKTETTPSAVAVASLLDDRQPDWNQQPSALGARMTVTEFVKLFKETPNVVVASTNNNEGKKKKRHLIKGNDLELIFTREKTVGEKTITFTQFMACVDQICAETRGTVKTFDGSREYHGRLARGLALLFDSWLTMPWAAEIQRNLEERSLVVLKAAATTMQLRWRTVRARNSALRMKLRREAEAQTALERNAVTRLQTWRRSRAARRRVAQLAKSHYVKFVVDRDELIKYAAESGGDQQRRRSPFDIHQEPVYYWAFNRLATQRKTTSDASRPAHVYWTKPRLLGSGDVDRVTQRPTSKTSFVVGCAFCGERTARKVCLGSCGDAFCEPCFEAAHRRGHRQDHAFQIIPTCIDCGGDQPASRRCGTCTAREGRNVDLCDVCFHNRHGVYTDPHFEGDRQAKVAKVQDRLEKAQLQVTLAASTILKPSDEDLTLKAEKCKEEMAVARMELKALRLHNWTPIVLPCESCATYAARWRCDVCEQSTCAQCYGRLHARGARLAHPCDRLGFYTPQVRSRDRRLRRQRERRKRLLEEEDAKRRADAAFSTKKDQAALLIQAAYRRKVDRPRGLAILKERRSALRRAWRRRKADDRIRTKLGYKLLDVIGKAPLLKSDTRKERVLKTVPQWKRAEATDFIEQNQPDDLWYVTFPTNFEDLPLNQGEVLDRKKRPKRGFEIGEMDELRSQALRGGVLLPAKATPTPGKRTVLITKSLIDIVSPGDRLIIGKSFVRVERSEDAVSDASIRLRWAWLPRKPDVTYSVYRLPPQEPLARFISLCCVRTSESCIAQQLIAERRVDAVNLLVSGERSLARKLRHRFPSLANAVKRRSKHHEHLATRLKWRTVAYQAGSDDTPQQSDHGLTSDVDDKPEAVPLTQAELDDQKNQRREDAYLGKQQQDPKQEDSNWEEISGGTWRNRVTGEESTEKPDDLKTSKELALEQAKRRMQKAKDQKQRRRR